MKKWMTLVLAVCLMAVCTAAPAEGVTVTDMLGREVSLDGPADQLVVMMPADAEILYAIGAKDVIVGCGMYCVSPEELAVMPELADVPMVNSGYETNVEQIIALAPDAVVMTLMGHSEELVATLEGAGIRVIITNAQDLNGVYDDIALLGALTGHAGEAAALTESMKADFDAIAQRAADAGLTGKRVYVEETELQWGLWAAGSHTYMDDIISLLGMTNIFADLEGHQSVSEEQVLAADPEVILTMTMYYGGELYPDQEILSRTGWEGVSAVKNKAVIYDPTNAVALPGPRLVNVAQMLLDVFTDAEAPTA